MSFNVTTPLPQARLSAARRAVLLVFLLNGVSFAAWASRIPDVKATLDLSASGLGRTLLAASIGAVLGLPASGWITARVGAARAVMIGLTSSTIGLTIVGMGVDVFASVPVVAAGLFVTGLGVGIWDVGMNLEGASVERHLGVSVMPHFHAAFSGGTVLSALLGALAARLGASFSLHVIPVMALVVGGCVWALRSFLPRGDEGDDPDRASDPAGADPAEATGFRGFSALTAWREPKTLMIGLLTFVAAFTEGTANDWVAVAFVEGHHLPTWAGVVAFATFLSFMTLGRLLGTRLLDRYGRVATLRAMFVAAGFGSLMVVFGAPWLAYVGAAVWGVGVSLGFPVGMSAAADDPARAAARMSVVSTIGYAAFIGGPPLLGELGDDVGVLRALLVVGAMLLVALVVLPAAREPERERLRRAA